MITFKIVNNNSVEIEPKVLLVPEFKLLLDKYGEEKGKKLLFLVYLFSDYSSPYADMIKEDRYVQVKKVSKITDLTEDEEADAQVAITYYDKLNERAYDRSLKVIDSMIDKLNHIINTHNPVLDVEIDAKTGKKYVINTSKAINELAASLDNVYAQREKLALRLSKKAVDEKTRANTTESILSSGQITGEKNDK